MTIPELKSKVLNGVQHYFNKQQVIDMLDQLNEQHVAAPTKPTSNPSNVLTLF